MEKRVDYWLFSAKRLLCNSGGCIWHSPDFVQLRSEMGVQFCHKCRTCGRIKTRGAQHLGHEIDRLTCEVSGHFRSSLHAQKSVDAPDLNCSMYWCSKDLEEKCKVLSPQRCFTVKVYTETRVMLVWSDSDSLLHWDGSPMWQRPQRQLELLNGRRFSSVLTFQLDTWCLYFVNSWDKLGLTERRG